MDWSRAKSVLIFSFLLLNIVLGYQLWMDWRERLNTAGDVTDLPQETLQIMQEKNIRLIGKIPSGTPELQDLEYRFTTTPSEAVRKELETPVDSRIIFTEKELMEGLGDVIPALDQYQYDPEASTVEVSVLYRMVDELPMFNVKLMLFNSNQKIIAYQQVLVEQVQPGQAKAQTVLSASKAVVPLIENYLQPGVVIKDIRLGYQGQVFNSEDQVAAPSWRVLLEDGLETSEVYYVNAISGEVVTEKDISGLTEEDQ
ncbi:two-component system regulatory protein YycI [Paenibacillus abyssi]|uniref:Regulatory protein YycH-like domain-containing protein n=1 Tax=Paenibacillus abyssi TaxID=1340531 RepID=A0A917CQL1_9BACL|nr:two-component system regulatory protein YycI [Paenibacillus abyssi]GGF94017.1 hypothetical protein GCM10010916_09190 [Paenibacillus abyssi]